MVFTVYVLKSLSTGKLYTGQTEDIQRRINEHQTETGPVRYTKGRGPWELVYTEDFSDRSQAMAREKYLKTGAGRDFIKRQLFLKG
ncbi:MAG: GIY-YIG nuclease family protein [Bacteroidales bacterium]|nr:GIY-YIG nuclease family protein [Bacteroidales bacterium]MDD4214047.1 GIY-YIG nuclease family protein [Bacteroidales bacterium]